jgi:phospholipid/cholesterol/gamma-HCH transport system permease protein
VSASATVQAAAPPGRLRRWLAAIGRLARGRMRFLLALAALMFGVVREALQVRSWRRTVRAEFRRALRLSAGGGLRPTMITAVLLGLAVVYETLYWLIVAGQEELIGTLMVAVVIREVAPMLVGLILLGRGGLVVLAELGAVRASGTLSALEAMGIDPFRLLVLPRAVAFAAAAFALGMVFVLVALTTGFVFGQMLSMQPITFWGFLDNVLRAMRVNDFAVFQAKLLLIGLLVILVPALTALEDMEQETRHLMPLGFLRTIIAILAGSGALSLAI